MGPGNANSGCGGSAAGGSVLAGWDFARRALVAFWCGYGRGRRPGRAVLPARHQRGDHAVDFGRIGRRRWRSLQAARQQRSIGVALRLRLLRRLLRYLLRRFARRRPQAARDDRAPLAERADLLRQRLQRRLERAAVLLAVRQAHDGAVRQPHLARALDLHRIQRRRIIDPDDHARALHLAALDLVARKIGRHAFAVEPQPVALGADVGLHAGQVEPVGAGAAGVRRRQRNHVAPVDADHRRPRRRRPASCARRGTAGRRAPRAPDTGRARHTAGCRAAAARNSR